MMHVEEHQGPEGPYYIVTDGFFAWSAVFTDRAKAQAFADKRNERKVP